MYITLLITLPTVSGGSSGLFLGKKILLFPYFFFVAFLSTSFLCPFLLFDLLFHPLFLPRLTFTPTISLGVVVSKLQM